MSIRGGQPAVLRVFTALCRALVALYPASTRRDYGDELQAVAEEMLRDAHARGGTSGVLRQSPRLMLDLFAALAPEHADAWQRSRHAPALALIFLSCAAFVWGLITVASNFDAGWAVRVLEFSLPLTVALALGLPLAAFASTHLALRRSPPADAALRQPRFLRRMSAAVTLAAWGVFACHVAG